MLQPIRMTGPRRGTRSTVLVLALLGSLAATVAAAQTSRPLQRMAVNGGEVEYETAGTGDPVLLIHGSGVAATFAPTMTEPALKGYRLIRYHRRGYAGSARAPVPFTVKDQAADALALLKALGVSRAHIVGHSYGGQIALQLALDAPAVVRSLVVMEPPIFNANGPSPFAKLEAMYSSGDKQGAMATFSQMSYGPDWRTLAARVPGGAAQVERDVDTVFQSEAPAMTKWGFDAGQAAGITQPIVYVTGGGAHGGSLKQLRVWIPRLEDVVVPGVTHAMLMQDPKAVADAIAAFIGKH
jgi:pimeloyl-ACP methyl ester carboxylesterase